jgi:putative endonuclease
MSRIKGDDAEQMALEYLLVHGLRLRQRNYSCRMGEIDLIMQDGEYLVFVEVRYRAHDDYGPALVSVTTSKQRKIMKTAVLYAQYHNLYNSCPMRFDIISFDGIDKNMTWMKNAFQAGQNVW